MSNDFQQQIDALWGAVRKLEQSAAERALAAGAPEEIPRIEIVVPKDASLELPAVAPESAEVPPQVEAAIKATLSAVLGKEVRIRSVTLLEKPDAPSTWAKKGRVALQSSHNQRTTRG